MTTRDAKFPKGEKMTVEEVAAVVGPEFAEMNENPPEAVVKVREEMEARKQANYRGRVAGLDRRTLGQLVEMAAESAELENWRDAEATRQVLAEAAKFERDVERLLEQWVRKHPLADDYDIDDLMDDGEAAYNLLMTLRGEGVGIWDGRWDHFFVDKREIKELESLAKRALGSYADDTGGGSLNQAFDDAAWETAASEEDMQRYASSGRYYVKPAPMGMFELRQTRFRNLGREHPHDVMAVARSLDGLEETVKGLGPEAAKAIEEYRRGKTASGKTMQKGKGRLAGAQSDEEKAEAAEQRAEADEEKAEAERHESEADRSDAVSKEGSMEHQRQRLTWHTAAEDKGRGKQDGTGPKDGECPYDKEAAGGLYGYTKATQRDIEASVRKVERQAAKIAKAIWAKDERTAAFLATHAKRASSLPARILCAAMKGVGPRVASIEPGWPTGHTHQAARDLLEWIRDNTRLHGQVESDDSLSFSTSGRGYIAVDPDRQTTVFVIRDEGDETVGMARNFRELKGLLDKAVQRAKMASTEKEAEFGIYGYPRKTATLGLNACTEIRSYAGQVAYDLHSRRLAGYDHITGFLGEHSKAARCQYSKLLLASYPDRPTEKAAAVAWKSVEVQKPVQVESSDLASKAVRDAILQPGTYAVVGMSGDQIHLKDPGSRTPIVMRVSEMAGKAIGKTARLDSPNSVEDWLAWEG